MNNYKYYTQDGHLMKNGEIMWRICDSSGKLFNKPELVNFSQTTGYNHLWVSNDNQKSQPHLNPYHKNHLHYYDYNNALKNIN
jgi:hypothetical protein